LAQGRLEAALARLETALEGSTPKDGGEVDELTRELQSARDELARYKDQNQQVSDRLDAAIGRMRTVLGE